MNRKDEFDLIRLNLQWMDALTSDKPLIDRLFSSAPILPFTIAFGLGILLSVGPLFALGVAFGVALISCAIALIDVKNSPGLTTSPRCVAGSP